MDWLFKEDNYVPEKDNDLYIEKSISSILKVISVIRKSYIGSSKSGFIYGANPSIKLCGTILTIVLLAVSRSFAFIGAADLILILMGIWQLKRDFIKPVMLAVTICLFTSVILIPSILMGNFNNSILLVLRVFGAVGYTALLSNTSRWDDISKALKIFFIPDIFIFTMETALKYINILGETALEMLYSLKVRTIGKSSRKYMGLSAIGGNLFLKSKEMSEEMYSAMECRGFTGEYGYKAKAKFTYNDLIYFTMNIAVIAIFIWQEVIK